MSVLPCTSYVSYFNATVQGSDCTYEASKFLKAIVCGSAIATCPATILFGTALCKASAQETTATTTVCFNERLNTTGTISLPPSYAKNMSSSSSIAFIETYNTNTCKSGRLASGLYSLQQCVPSPFNNDRWGIVYNDFSNNLYWDEYSDTGCANFVESKTGIALTKPGSTCVNQATAYLETATSFSVSVVYADTQCKTPARLIQAASDIPCTADSQCASNSAGTTVKTTACHDNPLAYSLEDQAKIVFGTKPYVFMEKYADKECKSASPVARGAFALDFCHEYGDDGSLLYTQAANGSAIVSYYSGTTCKGALKTRNSFITCDNFNKVTFFNTKNAGGVATVSKTSSGFDNGVASAIGIVFVSLLGMM